MSGAIWRSAVFSLPVLFFASGGMAAEYELRARLDALENRLAGIERYSSSGGTAGEARLSVRLGQIEEEMRQLRGSVEQVEYQNAQLRKELTSLSDDIDYRLQALEQANQAPATPPAPSAEVKIPTPTVVPASPPAAGEEMSVGTLPAPAKPGGRVPPAVPGGSPSSPASSAPAMKFSSPQDHYSYAFRLLNKAQYGEAEQVLRAFVQQYPKDRLVGNAWYWLGETYYVRADYPQAVDAFRQGFETVPEGTKAPDNLFKLGKTLGKMGNKDQACVVLKQIGVKFQGKAAPVLARAAEERTALGCAD